MYVNGTYLTTEQWQALLPDVIDPTLSAVQDDDEDLNSAFAKEAIRTGGLTWD